MQLHAVDPHDARAVLRGLRGAVLGAGPAIALGAPSAAASLPAEVPPGTAVIVTTSGSTGYPKSVVLSRSALTSSALATAQRIGTGAWLLALPPGYIAGVQVLVRALVAGREPAVLSGSFSATAFAAAALAMASSEGGRPVPAFTSLVPAQLQSLVEAAERGDADVPRAVRGFEAILVGGQALPAPLAERAASLGARIIRTYGSSETSGGCVYDGVPLDGVAVRVRDGEVQLSGPMLAEGYLGDPERTEAAFVREGSEGRDAVRWYRTGDTGTFDDNHLRVSGRVDNVIVSGGINVSLDRVEQVVRRLAGFESAVVVAVPDEKWGQASVVVRVGVGLEGDELERVREVVGAELGPPARPRAILPRAELPMLTSGKPDRAALLAWARSALD